MQTAEPAPLSCIKSDEITKVDQFKIVEKSYKKLNCKTGLIEVKKAKVTERFSKQMTYRDLFNLLISLKVKYCVHKYQVYNDKHHWPIILATVPDYESILHLDYSENLSQVHKHELQSAHFNKRSYILHCRACRHNTIYHLSIAISLPLPLL